MRGKILILALATAMALLMGVMAAPAFAQESVEPGSSFNLHQQSSGGEAVREGILKGNDGGGSESGDGAQMSGVSSEVERFLVVAGIAGVGLWAIKQRKSSH